MHDDLAIYEQAVKLWGATAQRLMLIEECGELITAMVQWWRGRATDDDLISEMVDVYIMINQMRVILNDESKWERTFTYKISRIRERIDIAKDARGSVSSVCKEMKEMNKYGDCELSCFRCGAKADLMQVAHRDCNDFVVGYLFLCKECLLIIGGNYSVSLSEIQTAGVMK